MPGEPVLIAGAVEWRMGSLAAVVVEEADEEVVDELERAEEKDVEVSGIHGSEIWFVRIYAL